MFQENLGRIEADASVARLRADAMLRVEAKHRASSGEEL